MVSCMKCVEGKQEMRVEDERAPKDLPKPIYVACICCLFTKVKNMFRANNCMNMNTNSYNIKYKDDSDSDSHHNKHADNNILHGGFGSDRCDNPNFYIK